MGLSILFFAVCTPISIWASGDVLIAESIFPTVWDLFQSFVQFLVYWVVTVFLSLLMIRTASVRSCLPLLGWYAATAVLRIGGSLILGSFITADGFGSDAFSDNVWYALLDLLLDFILVGLVLLTLYLLIFRKSTVKSDDFHLPPNSFFKQPTRLHVAVAAAVAIPSVIRLIGRIRYDIDFGAPQNTADLLWMVFYYLADLISVLIGYLTVLLLLKKLSNPREGDVK